MVQIVMDVKVEDGEDLGASYPPHLYQIHRRPVLHRHPDRRPLMIGGMSNFDQLHLQPILHHHPDRHRLMSGISNQQQKYVLRILPHFLFLHSLFLLFHFFLSLLLLSLLSPLLLLLLFLLYLFYAFGDAEL